MKEDTISFIFLHLQDEIEVVDVFFVDTKGKRVRGRVWSMTMLAEQSSC